MFGSDKFRGWLQRPVLEKKDSPSPDYTPMAQASKESAEIMAGLGREQLAFARQQYDDSLPLFQQIVGQQMRIGDQTAQQGQDYYDYLKSFRPAEQQLLSDSAQGPSSAMQQMQGLATGTNQDVYNWRKADIDQQVGQAFADTQNGYTKSLNQLARQGMRYGASPAAITQMAGSLGAGQASALAAAANNARTAGIQQARGLAGQNYGLLQQQDATTWGKRLDAVGLAKGLTGASTGAYGLASGAFNAAGHNQMAPGQQYMQGMAQGASTIGSGRQMYQSGLGNILNTQASVYANSQDDGLLGGLGSVMGGLASMKTAGMF